MNLKFSLFVVLIFASLALADKTKKENKPDKDKAKKEHKKPVPCTCGVFLSGQIKKGSRQQPKGEPALTQEMESHFANNSVGQRQCANKCLEIIIKHLPKSADIICATVDRDCHKEKAFLFTKNYDSAWVNSNMSAGREFCCKDNEPYKCPLI